MRRNLTEKESMLCQIIATTSLIIELINNDFLKSEYYRKLNWSGPEINIQYIKKILAASGLSNPAMMQMCLYALLVIPRELLDEHSEIAEAFNEETKKHICSYISKYRSEENKEKSDYYRHIRNAVAHSRCEYTIKNGICYVTFNDQKGENQTWSVTMKTADVGMLLHILKIELMKVLN